MKEIPEEVLQFVVRHFQSVAEIELSLFLNDNPEKEWMASEISKAIHLDRSAVERLLKRLVSSKLLSDRDVSGRRMYRLNQSDKLVHAMLTETGKWYSTHHVKILGAIYGKPIDGIQTFAGSFRLRNKKD